MQIERLTGKAAAAHAAALATLYAAAFGPSDARLWSADEFRDLAHRPTSVFLIAGSACLIADVIADEAEILTLSVAPDKQNEGLGRTLLTELDRVLALRSVIRVFLEVASDNYAAIYLYESAGYTQVGCRPDYFIRKSCSVDAIVMQKQLTDISQFD